MQAKNKGKTVDLVKKFESGQVTNSITRNPRQNVIKLPNTLNKNEFKECANFKNGSNFSNKTSSLLKQAQPTVSTEKKTLADSEPSQETNTETIKLNPTNKNSNVENANIRPIPAKRPTTKNEDNKAITQPTPIPRKPSYLNNVNPPEKKNNDDAPVTKVNDNQNKSAAIRKNDEQTKQNIKDNNINLNINHGRSQNIVSGKNQNIDLGNKRLLHKQQILSLPKVKETEDDKNESKTFTLVEEVLDDDEITNEILKNSIFDNFDELDLENYLKEAEKKDPSVISVDPDCCTESFHKLKNYHFHNSHQSISDNGNEKSFENKHKRTPSSSNNCNIHTTYSSNEAKIHIKFDNYTNIELEDALQQFHKYLETKLSSNHSNSSPSKQIFEKPSHRNFTDSKSRFFTWNKKMGRSSTWNHQTRRRMLNLNSFEDLSESCEKDAAPLNKEMLNPRLNRSYSSSVVERKDCSILHYNGSTSTVNTDNSDIEFERNSLSKWKRMFKRYSSGDSLNKGTELNEEIGKNGTKRRWLFKNIFSPNKHRIEK
ncbi:putative uncharacterized protein DDB_G0282133 [Hydra vulgaris]|uniref:putative uncharacterized protein DDB_G0282133 n=1 Tax=Hydra vulgaris TaxID=6087 RepID=UPI0001926FAA|nr:putative uncharacterized protein DDB_G0282133 [Hydra vulgaris]XP_047128920.1 putative uncharacterized protein DDB_G0282133 [Hydra vulgaris]